MPRWLVEVKKVTRYEIEVDADGYFEAMKAARETSSPESAKHHISTDPIRQLGEPWARSQGWYDLHEKDDIVVVETAFGNSFTEADVDLLHKRLVAMGFPPVDSWNGTGCQTVSFRCSGRKGGADFTPEQQAALVAPRT